MKSIFFVKPDEFEKAKNMERKLLSLPKESGILFVSASVQEGSEEGKPNYKIVVGCTRERDPEGMCAVAKHFLRSFVDEEKQLLVEAHRGSTRSV